MKKEKFYLFEWFPPQTLENWLDTYKGWVAQWYLIPKESRTSPSNQDFLKSTQVVAKLLKSKGYKFI